MTSHTMVKVVGSWTLAGALSLSVATAQNGNSSGVTANEIRIGNIMTHGGAGFRQTGSELEGLQVRDDAAGHYCEYKPERFLSHPANAADVVRWLTWRLFGEVIDLSTERRQ